MFRLIVVALAAIGGILFVAFVASRIGRSRRTGLSIRMQVFLALAAVVGAFAVGVGILVVDRVQARTVRFATQAATDEASSLASLLSAQWDPKWDTQWNNSTSDLYRLGERLHNQPGTRDNTSWKFLSPSGREAFGPSVRDRVEQSAEGPLVQATADVLWNGKVVGRVVVSKPTLVIRRMLRDFAPTVLVISLVLGAAAALSAYWIGRSIAAPIQALSAFSERVSLGKQGAQPPPSPWGREVTRLTNSIDSMRRQLEGRPFAERFATDLSHELKNPVAAIRASAEVLEEGALEEPAQARHFVGRIREATERIERLLSELLQLARFEASPPEDRQPLDLVRMCREQSEECVTRGRIQFESPPTALVLGEARWLSRAIRNLLENAALHGPEASPVRINIGLTASQVELMVSNQGEIPEHLRDRLFQRFVTTREDKGGTGLGLAIVRAVAEAHGGHAWLVRSGPPWVTFGVSLPRPPHSTRLKTPTA